MKHMLRKTAYILLAAGMALSFSACGGGVEARAEPAKTQAAVGESLSTLFFDWSVNTAQSVESYEDSTAPEGEKLVLANVTVKNTTEDSITMFDGDFTLAWGEGEEEFAWVFDAFTDAMQPPEDTLKAGESGTYDLLFSVPEAQKDLSVCYTEAYEDEKGEAMTGYDFKVTFSV